MLSQIIFVLSLGVAGLWAVTVTTNFNYYSYNLPRTQLNCSQKWDKYTQVSFFNGTTLLFNSSRPAIPSLATPNLSNMTITLNNTNNRNSWSNVICQVNKTRSANSLSIPFVLEPTITNEPAKFELKKNQTIRCQTITSLQVGLIYEFSLNKTVFATLIGKNVQTSKVPGLNITIDPKHSDGIIVTPNLASNRGIYKCALNFTSNGKQERLESINSFNTNSASFVTISGFLSLVVASLISLLSY